MDWGKIIEHRRAERNSQIVPVIPVVPLVPEFALVFVPVCVSFKLV